MIDKLEATHELTPQEYRTLLADDDEQVCEYLRRRAQAVAIERFGRGIYVRGLIEIGNRCRNNCYYCGIRQANRHIERYSLSAEEVLACCQRGYDLGFRTFVLQGGELTGQADNELLRVVERIHTSFPECAITLSVGEKSEAFYRRLFDAGATRYLLRHETADAAHYARLHPAAMSLSHRKECLHLLQQIGYQTGTGMMVGSPWQTLDHLVSDLSFIEKFRPQMVGIGPFIPHPDTPLAPHPAGSLSLTLKLISIIRLMLPHALIPSTTALATLSPEGRRQGIRAGANVVMPNLSPPAHRDQYALYQGKANTGAEAAEGVNLLRAELHSIGYEIDWSRGDFSLTVPPPSL